MSIGLLTADMNTHYAFTAPPVYTKIPVYVIDGEEGLLDEVDTAPPLVKEPCTGQKGPLVFKINPFAWLLYDIDEETEEEMVELEMEED